MRPVNTIMLLFVYIKSQSYTFNDACVLLTVSTGANYEPSIRYLSINKLADCRKVSQQTADGLLVPDNVTHRCSQLIQR